MPARTTLSETSGLSVKRKASSVRSIVVSRSVRDQVRARAVVGRADGSLSDLHAASAYVGDDLVADAVDLVADLRWCGAGVEQADVERVATGRFHQCVHGRGADEAEATLEQRLGERLRLRREGRHLARRARRRGRLGAVAADEPLEAAVDQCA